jgi:hypothetical protein
MDQARLEKYAGWLVQNKDKKGTPEFETVATAYKTLRSGGPQEAPKSYDLADVPAAAIENAPENAKELATGAIEGVASGVKQAYKDVTEQPLLTIGKAASSITPAALAGKAFNAAKEYGTHLYDSYGGYEKAKTSIAEKPVTALLDAAAIIPAVPKGVGLASRGMKKLNKSKTEYPEVSGDVARDLRTNADSGDNPLPRFAGDETKVATNKLHTNYKVEIDADKSVLNDLLDPAKAADEAGRLARLEASKAFSSANHLRMDKSLKSEIAAVEKLVGHTKEGVRLVNNLKKQVEVARLGSKVKGGLSQFTDELNPLSTGGGRFGVKGLPQVFTAGNVASAPLMGGANLIAQGAAVTTGRLVDLATGRGNLARKYMKDNEKAPAAPSTDGLVDLADQSRKAAAIAEQEARLVKATREKDALQAKVEKVKTTQAKETYKEAAAENKRYDDVVAAAKRKQKAIEALEKKNAPKEAKAPKQDFGISPLAVSRVKALMQKKAAESAKLEKAVEGGAKAEAKANAPDAPKVRETQVRDRDLYEAGKARIIAQEHAVDQAASRTKLPGLRKLLTEAKEDLRKSDAKGRKNHKRRVEIYEEALAKAKTSHEKAVIKSELRNLAFTFSGKK